MWFGGAAWREVYMIPWEKSKGQNNLGPLSVYMSFEIREK
jgi:hypothetical protein